MSHSSDAPAKAPLRPFAGHLPYTPANSYNFVVLTAPTTSDTFSVLGVSHDRRGEPGMTFDGRSPFSAPPPCATVEALCERYHAFLLDAYGVLVDGSNSLPGAASFLHRLIDAGRPFIVLSNDASRLPATASARYRGFGLPVTPDHILTSGSLVGPYLQREGLAERPCIVLGPPETSTFVTDVGGTVVAPDDTAAEVLIVCDDGGYPFLPTIEDALSTAIHRLDRDLPIALLLPNPDRVYPKSPGKIGLTAGSVALVIESALRQRFGDYAPSFVRLGKPHSPIFEAALQRLGTAIDRSGVVMFGDQLQTDVAGANASGIDSVLVGTGVAALDRDFSSGPRPSWLLAGFPH